MSDLFQYPYNECSFCCFTSQFGTVVKSYCRTGINILKPELEVKFLVHNKYPVSVTKINWLMLFTGTIGVHSANHAKQKIFCGPSAKFLFSEQVEQIVALCSKRLTERRRYPKIHIEFN